MIGARQSTAVAIEGRALLVEGPPGSGKTSLALALVDRGAVLIGDDSVMTEAAGDRVIVRPHPRTCGLVEVRGLGLLPFPVHPGAPAALVILLDPAAPRFIDAAESIAIAGVPVPMVRLEPHGSALPIVAELALRRYGLSPG